MATTAGTPDTRPTEQRQPRPAAEILSLDGRLSLLAACPSLRGLTRPRLAWLARLAHERCVPAGGWFFRQGDAVTALYVLTRGKVKLTSNSLTGRQTILDVIDPLAPFGHVAALEGTGGCYPVSAEALERSRALAWEPTVILKTVTENPPVAVAWLRHLARQVEHAWENVEELATDCVERRLAWVLVERARNTAVCTPADPRITIALTRQDLADIVGCTRATISRVLTRWHSRGIVDRARARIEIRDIDQLTRIRDGA